MTETKPEQRKSNAGRKPYDTILKFKIVVLQSLHNLSDERTEYLIRGFQQRAHLLIRSNTATRLHISPGIRRRNNTLADLKSAKNRPPWRLAYPARNVDWPCRAICRMLFAEGRVSLAFGDAQISFREARYAPCLSSPIVLRLASHP